MSDTTSQEYEQRLAAKYSLPQELTHRFSLTDIRTRFRLNSKPKAEPLVFDNQATLEIDMQRAIMYGIPLSDKRKTAKKAFDIVARPAQKIVATIFNNTGSVVRNIIVVGAGGTVALVSSAAIVFQFIKIPNFPKGRIPNNTASELIIPKKTTPTEVPALET